MPRLVKVDLGVKPVQDQHGYRVCAGSTDCNTNNLYLLCMQDQQEDQRPFKDWRLAKDSELRLEVAPEDTIEIQVLPYMEVGYTVHGLPYMEVGYSWSHPPYCNTLKRKLVCLVRSLWKTKLAIPCHTLPLPSLSHIPLTLTYVHVCSHTLHSLPLTCHPQLLLGVGEIFGTELAKNKPYTIYSRAKIAVFTWYGCTVRISSNYHL